MKIVKQLFKCGICGKLTYNPEEINNGDGCCSIGSFIEIKIDLFNLSQEELQKFASDKKIYLTTTSNDPYNSERQFIYNKKRNGPLINWVHSECGLTY